MAPDAFHTIDCTQYSLGQRTNFIIFASPEGQTGSVKVYIGGFFYE
jgi:hypothetical protein